VARLEQRASFDAIPPHIVPANVHSRSEQRPNGLRSASYHRPDAVRSASRWRLPHGAGAVIRLPRGNGRHTPVRFHSPIVDWSRILPAGGVAVTGGCEGRDPRAASNACCRTRNASRSAWPSLGCVVAITEGKPLAC